MITIDQLLESVDLDFEPRWVTKASDGKITLYKCKPVRAKIMWWEAGEQEHYNGLKLSEFEGKDWTECIYEVPRKEEPKGKIKIGTLYIDESVTFGDGDDDDVGVVLEDYEVPQKTDEYEQNLEKLRPADSDLVYRVKLPRKTTGKIEKIHIPDMNEVAESAMYSKELAKRLNQVIDAVNELKGAKNE